MGSGGRSKPLPYGWALVHPPSGHNDKDFQEAMGMRMEQIKRFNPEVYGYEWATELAPRIQLASEG